MEFGGYFLECGKKTHGRKSEAQGVLSYQKAKGIFDNPQYKIVFRCFGSDDGIAVLTACKIM